MKKILSSLTILVGGFILILSVQAQMSTVVSITGSVFNSVTKAPIRIQYKLLNKQNRIIRRGRTNASQNGYYFITGLLPGENYKIAFEGGKYYFDVEYDIDIPQTDKYAEFSKDFLVPPKSKGMELPQRVPVFELNKSKLRGGAAFFLDEILNTLKENETIKFTIVSYPDNDKDPNFNNNLTKGRCESLKDFFITQGISANRINIAPKQKTDPKNPPPTEKRAKGKRYIGSVYYQVNEF